MKRQSLLTKNVVHLLKNERKKKKSYSIQIVLVVMHVDVMLLDLKMCLAMSRKILRC